MHSSVSIAASPLIHGRKSSRGIRCALQAHSLWCVKTTRNPTHRSSHFRGQACGFTSTPRINNECGRTHQHLHIQHARVAHQMSLSPFSSSSSEGADKLLSQSWLQEVEGKYSLSLWFVVWKETRKGFFLTVNTQMCFKSCSQSTIKRHIS